MTAARSASAEPTDALREQIARAYYAWTGEGDIVHWDDARSAREEAFSLADAVLALPAVRDLAVENRRLRETVKRSRNLTPVRRAALVLSDGELSDALDLWYARRAPDAVDVVQRLRDLAAVYASDPYCWTKGDDIAATITAAVDGSDG